MCKLFNRLLFFFTQESERVEIAKEVLINNASLYNVRKNNELFLFNINSWRIF